MNVSSSEYFNQMFKEAFLNYYFLTFLCFLIFIYVILIFCKEKFDSRQVSITIEENNLKLNLKKTEENHLTTFKDNFLEKAN